jgi:hypothetical protein
LGIVLVVLTVGMAGAFAADFTWEFSLTTRLTLLCGVLGTTAVAAFWWIARPCSTRFDSADLAALIERKRPDLMERLTSTVELNDPDIPEAHKGSALMRELLTRQTVTAVSGMDFGESAPPTRATRWGVAGCVAVLLLVAPFLFSGSNYCLLWARFFHPQGNYDRAANLFFTIDKGNRVVARGSDVVIVAQPKFRTSTEELPQTVWLNWTDAEGEADARRMEYDAEREAFVTTRPHVFHGFDYNISAENSRSRNYRITVVERPVITVATLNVEPPAYTGFPAERFDGLLGEMTVFEQSRLSLSLKFNKPVTAAELRWLETSVVDEPADDENAVAATPARRQSKRTLRLSKDRTTATLKWNATLGGTFAFRVADRHGLRNSEEPDRRLTVAFDQPPALQLAENGRRTEVPPSDVVAVDVLARDDIAIGALELHYEILTRDGRRGTLAVEAVQLDKPTIEHRFELDLASLGIPDGTVIEYRVRAADERPKPGPHEVWSERQTLIVRNTAPPQGSNAVANRQADLKKMLEEIARDIGKNRDEVAELQQEADSDVRMQLQFSRDKNIPPLTDDQQTLSTRLEQLAARFAQHPLYANLVDQTREVARIDLAAARGQLKKTVPAPLREKVDLLKQTEQLLTDAQDKLDALDDHFDELAQLEQDLLELKRLGTETEKLALAASELDRQMQQPAPANTTPPQQQARQQQQQALAKQQQDLAAQLQALLDRRPELLEAARRQELDHLAQLAKRASELAEPQDQLAEALRKESEESVNALKPLIEKQQEILKRADELAAQAETERPHAPVTPFDPAAVRKAIEELKNGNAKQAAANQEVAAAELDRLAAELKMNEQLPSDPQKAVRELQKRQEDLTKRIAAASQDAAAGNATDEQKQQQEKQLRPLAAEQAGLQAGLAKLQLPKKDREQQQAAVDQAAKSVNDLLAGRPEPASAEAKKTGEQLAKLAQQIGSEEDRKTAAAEQLAALRKQQADLAKQVDKATQADKPAEAKQRLQELAGQQEELAKKLADLDTPTATEEQQDAVQDAAAALTDLRKQRTADAPASQARAEQALARLEKKLAGEKTPEQVVEDIRKQQEQIAKQAGEALKNSDEQQLARQAEKQQQIAEALGKLDAPAARPETAAAKKATQNAAEQLSKAEKPEDADAVLKRADEAIARLAKAVDPARQDPSEQVEQLAKRQQQAAVEAREAAKADAVPTPEKRQQDQDQLAEVARDAEQLRAGDVASAEKKEALETLRKAEKAREQTDQLVKKQQPKSTDPETLARKPDEELQRLMKREADAQQQAADALQRLQKRLDGEDAKEQLARRHEEEAKQAEQLAKRNRTDPAELAKQAAQLAREQAALRKQTEQLDGEKDPVRIADQEKQLAKAQEELRKRAQELPAEQAALERAEAMQKLKDAGEALQKGEAKQAVAEQRQAEDALQRLQKRAEALAKAQSKPKPAGNPQPQQKSTAERLAQLAQEQRALQQELDELRKDPIAQKKAEQPGQPQPQPALARQQELARQAAQLALDTARQNGAKSPTTQQAREFAKQADQAARQALAGQPKQAGEASQQAAEAAQRTAKRFGADNPDSPNQALGKQARQMAKQQAELTKQFAQQAASPAGRNEARQAGQQQLAQAARQLAKQLGDAAQRLNQQPLNLGQRGSQAQDAGKSAQQSQQAMQQAAKGDANQAAQAAKQAAQALRQAAQQAGQSGQPITPQAPAGQPASPIPANVAQQVAEAARQLKQAQQQLAQAQPGMPMGNQPSSALAKSAQSLQQAAQALAQAAQQLQPSPGQGTPSQPGSSPSPAGQPNPNQQANANPPGAPSSELSSGDGNGAPVSVDLKQLDSQLKKLTNRQWGQLPGRLQSEILQAARRKPSHDYAKLIKAYFKEIAKTNRTSSD